MSHIIIGITGLARSGKDTVADYIAEKYTFKVFTMSDTLKGECMKRGLEITKDNLSIIGDRMREEFGNDIVAVRTLEKAEQFPRSIITGVRSPEETHLFKSASKHFILLAVTSDNKKRFKRRSKNDPQTETAFHTRDERDTINKGMGEVIETADTTIENNTTLKDLYEKVDIFISSLDVSQ